jgi:hypothetical protein
MSKSISKVVSMTAWQTTDGKVHSNPHLAIKHQKELDFGGNLQPLLQRLFPNVLDTGARYTRSEIVTKFMGARGELLALLKSELESE